MSKRSRNYDNYQDRPAKREATRRDDDNFKTLDEVFDHQNLMFIYDLFKKDLINSVDYPIATGKESNVFLCTTSDGEKVVLKVFRTATATFDAYLPYLEGDMRFERIKPDRRGIIYAWCLKEFKNLQRLKEAKIRAPVPMAFHKNMLIMSEITFDGKPAPMLKRVELSPEDLKEVWKEVLGFMVKMYKKAELVHADLSEYNILISNDGPVMIDLGQAVLKTHPMADQYLKRDAENMVRYFNNGGLDLTVEGVMKKVVGKAAN